MIDLEGSAREAFGRGLAELGDDEVCRLLPDLERERARELPVVRGKRRLYYVSAEFHLRCFQSGWFLLLHPDRLPGG